VGIKAFLVVEDISEVNIVEFEEEVEEVEEEKLDEEERMEIEVGPSLLLVPPLPLELFG